MSKDTSMLSGMGNLNPDAAKMSKNKGRVSLKDLMRLLSFTGTSKGQMFLLICAAVISGGIQVVAPYFLAKTVDHMGKVGSVDFSFLATRALILLGMYLGASFFTWVVSYFANIVAARTAQEVRQRLSHKLSVCLCLSTIRTRKAIRRHTLSTMPMQSRMVCCKVC